MFAAYATAFVIDQLPKREVRFNRQLQKAATLSTGSRKEEQGVAVLAHRPDGRDL